MKQPYDTGKYECAGLTLRSQLSEKKCGSRSCPEPWQCWNDDDDIRPTNRQFGREAFVDFHFTVPTISVISEIVDRSINVLFTSRHRISESVTSGCIDAGHVVVIDFRFEGRMAIEQIF